MRKILLSLLIIFTVCISGCSVGAGTVVTYHNNDIDQKILDEIKTLDDKVLGSIKNNQADKILEFCSETYKKDWKNHCAIIDSIHSSSKGMSFDYKNRYYCKVEKVGNHSFSVETLKDDPFNIKLDAVSKDIFVSLIKTNSNIEDYMLSLIYIKENGKWKLNTMYFGGYSYDGMNAFDLYNKAKLLDEKGDKMPSYIYLKSADRLLQPAPFLRYKKEKEIFNYFVKVCDSVKKAYAFPKKLENTRNITIQKFDVRYVVNEGIMPVIEYKTGIELSKDKEIKEEANNMNEEVMSLFSGMKENFKFVMYETTSEPTADPKAPRTRLWTVVEQK